MGTNFLPGALDDPKMSREHAAIEIRKGDATLSDCDSRNGTFLNGQRVERAVLRPGDVIGLGDLRLVFQRVPDGFRSANDPVLWGVGPGIASVISELLLAAPTVASTLVLGEPGVGKELAARVLHAASGRRGDLVAVNCSGLDDGVVNSELFGHKRGAFSGAVSDRPGLVAQADRGTLFLDEIGDASAALQTTLLRLLQEGEVRTVGADRTRKVDVRVVAATNRDLVAEAGKGSYRRDLVTRLEGWVVRIPPLRERREDICPLALQLVRRDRPESSLSLETAELLVAHDWPGNVRELSGVVRRLLTGNTDSVLHAGDWLQAWVDERTTASVTPDAPPRRGPRRARPVRPSRDDLLQRLSEHGGNLTAAAGAMGVGRATLYRWVRQLDIDLEGVRRA